MSYYNNHEGRPLTREVHAANAASFSRQAAQAISDGKHDDYLRLSAQAAQSQRLAGELD